ncbi:MAG TPA: serine protease, partial [Allosphingosinicella sp.]
SVGIFSNVRPINGITTLLHTANIARGHSGGPLLDQCGRVLGVNTLITRNQEGDSTFAFAVGNREVTAFLREAQQPFQSVATECVAMADRLRQDQERTAAEEQRRQAELAARQEQARERALAQVQERRESRLAIAVLLLVLSLLAFGGAGIMIVKNRQRPAMMLGGAGILLLIGSVIVFATRPSMTDAQTPPEGNSADAGAAAMQFAGRNNCELVPERSRVTVSSTDAVPLEWNENGCVNRRTQYAREGETWTRILVPEGEQAVSVLQFKPGTGEYVVTRYLLDAGSMGRIRSLRHGIDVKACTDDNEARTVLADQQREIGRLLPQLPNERLVYRCRNQGGAAANAT